MRMEKNWRHYLYSLPVTGEGSLDFEYKGVKYLFEIYYAETAPLID
jgi:hypothetical protein